jgi:hypothetical protein
MCQYHGVRVSSVSSQVISPEPSEARDRVRRAPLCFALVQDIPGCELQVRLPHVLGSDSAVW